MIDLFKKKTKSSLNENNCCCLNTSNIISLETNETSHETLLEINNLLKHMTSLDYVKK